MKSVFEVIWPISEKIFTQASDVDIDHIVPLAHAHQHGADSWTKKQGRAFVNDFDNLVVVSDKTNHAKSDKATMNGCRLAKSIGVSMASDGSTLSINTN